MTTTLTRGLSPVRTPLDSGAVVIVQETSTTAAVTINATVRAGGVHEPDALPGIAHLTSRVLDRGTASRTADMLAEELDDRGVALRLFPTRHTTAVTCTCLAEDFEDVLAIVLDVIRNPIFPEEEVAKRGAEVLTALRQDADNPAVRSTDVLFEMLYGASHPYGRPAKGTPESVERMTRDDLVAFHRARFRPSSLSLAIVGQVEARHALDRAVRQLDGWSGEASEEPPMPAPRTRSAREQRVVEMPGKSQADIAYGFIAIERLDPKFYAYYVMNNILGQFGLGGRLADNIRERQGMAYYAFSLFDPSLGPGPLMVRAGVDPANVERTVDAIDHEVGTLGTGGPTTQELTQSQQYLIGSLPRTLETNAGIAHFLQNAEIFGLGLDYDQRLPERLRAVTIEDVGAAATELLHPERAAIAIAGPPALPSPPQA
jgi:zinc protease